MNARTTALTVLIACRRQGAWSNGILKEYIQRDRLDRRDAALCAQISYGVMQNEALLDDLIGQCLTKPNAKLQPIVRDILRIGAYQLLFLDRVPANAAVNEAVEACKRSANPKAAGLVNAVLRRFAGKKDELHRPRSLSVRYSHPEELVELLRQSVGEQKLEAFLAADNSVPETVFQCNPLKADCERVEKELDQYGVRYRRHAWLPGAYLVSGTGDVETLPIFSEGRVYVQDPAAKLAVLASGVQAGMRVLDCCAAPGGKSFAAAMQMENRGSVLSCDIHAHKTALIEKGAQRLGISIIQAQTADAAQENPTWLEMFDTVIADVPCSGLGVIRKKPDIRYRDLEQTQRLPEIQREILENVSRYVRPGGVLLYSTCTVLKRENEAVAESFLQSHPEFSPESFPVFDPLSAPQNGMLTLLPCTDQCDGFFICKMRRSK